MLGRSGYTWSGFNYWDDANTIFCEMKNRNSKAVYFDISSSESISKAHDFQGIVDDIKGLKSGVAWSLVAGVILGVLFVDGVIVATLSDEALAAVGVVPSLYNFCHDYHSKLLSAQRKFEEI